MIIIWILLGLAGGIFFSAVIVALIVKSASVYEDQPTEKNPLEGKKVEFVFDNSDVENADGVCGHLVPVADTVITKYRYDFPKRVLDFVLSTGALIFLSPFLFAIGLAIYIDDPGPILFTQKRVGKNKRYFKLHKFRSMKMSTPHDIPTHMLENPDQYITRVGRFIRAHSLDELPQIFDIFLGNMSFVGPRPALWNQDLLTAERDKYCANDMMPGLTGLAQINGRDELEIAEKAKFDGEYVQNYSFRTDLKCFLGSIHVLRKDDTIIEGGTGELKSRGKQYK